MSMDNRRTVTTQRVGGFPEGAYIVVTLDVGSASGTSVNHEPITDARVIAIVGEEYVASNCTAAGQIYERLADITKPAAGWDAEEIRELATLWERWANNDLNAACAHMDTATLVRDGEGRIATGKANTCPESGYTYGSAWLIDPIPEDVAERILHLFRDRSDDLYRERGYDAFGQRYPKE